MPSSHSVLLIFNFFTPPCENVKCPNCPKSSIQLRKHTPSLASDTIVTSKRGIIIH